MRGLDPRRRAPTAAQQLADQEAREPFDLARGPLLRARLLVLGAGEQVLLLTMHQIVSDGWSIGVLLREMATLYEAYSRGAESPLDELPIQYADFAHWQRGYLRGEVLARQLAYWREQLGAQTCPCSSRRRARARVRRTTRRAARCARGVWGRS